MLAGFFTPGNVGSSYAISPVCGLEWVRGGTKEAPAGPNVRVNGMAEDRFK